MRMEQLKCFLEVARAGSITGAAQQLYISQQSASQNIKQLEQELNCELLVRGKNGISLTLFGKEVAEFAKQVLEEQDTLQNKLINMKAAQNMEEHWFYKIVSTSPVTNIVLPRIIAEMDAKGRKIDLQLSITENVDAVMRDVADGIYDIGLVSFNEEEMMKKFSAVEHDIHLEVLARDEMVGVIDRRFYRGQEAYLTADELKNRRRTMYNIIPVEALRCYIERDKNIISYSDADFHRRMLENGAIVMMPGLAYEHFFNSKKFIALPMEDIDVSLIHAAIYRDDEDAKLHEFIKLIRKEMYIK